MDVYLLHFRKKLAHAAHYIGIARNVEERLKQHRCGQGARLMAVLHAAGIEWDHVRTWKNVDRAFERKLKKRKNASHLCPVCRQAVKDEAKGLTSDRRDEEDTRGHRHSL